MDNSMRNVMYYTRWILENTAQFVFDLHVNMFN